MRCTARFLGISASGIDENKVVIIVCHGQLDVQGRQVVAIRVNVLVHIIVGVCRARKPLDLPQPVLVRHARGRGLRLREGKKCNK